MFRIYFCVLCALVSACERDGPAPVRMKIYDDLYMPAVATSVGKDSQSYQVKEGETLFDVAYRFSIDPMNLAQINNIKPPYDVDTGQILRLPSQEVARNFSNEEKAVVEKKVVVRTDKQLDSEFADMLTTASTTVSATASNGTGRVSHDKASTASNSNHDTPKSKSASSKQTAGAVSTQNTAAEKASVANSKSAKSTNGKEPATAHGAHGKWITPVPGKIVSRFGDVTDGIANDGIDIAAPLGTPVKAVASGKVIYAGNGLSDEYKNVVLIDHGVHGDARLITSSALLKDIKVKKGMQVKAGDTIGTVGKGDHGSQLHFEIMKQTGHDAVPLNPSAYVGF